MAVRPCAFDPRKALEAILLVASNVREPTFHSVSKVLYFADKLHLQRFGRLVSGDDYVAMKHGPVPSAIYNMMKVPLGKGSATDVAEVLAAIDVEDGHRLKVQRNPDLSLLSRSEQDCLLESIEQYGRKTFKELTAASHDAAWQGVDENEFITVEDIAKTLPNSDDLIDYLKG